MLLHDQPNAYAASRAGETAHWVGSDIGWIIFGIGMLTLLIGGLTAAAGMQGQRVRPAWVLAFTATLGVGVLAANLFALQSVLVSAPVLALQAGRCVSPDPWASSPAHAELVAPRVSHSDAVWAASLASSSP